MSQQFGNSGKETHQTMSFKPLILPNDVPMPSASEQNGSLSAL